MFTIRQDRQNVKKVKITIHGTITYSAQRTFEIEVPDDEDVEFYDRNTVSDLADDAGVSWSFGEYGHLQTEWLTIDSMTDGEESSPANFPITDPLIAKVCSVFRIDVNHHDPGLGDEPPVSF